MSSLEICKSIFIGIEYFFLLLYDVLTIVCVCYWDWSLIVIIITYDEAHVSIPVPFMGAFMDWWNMSLVSLSVYVSEMKPYLSDTLWHVLVLYSSHIKEWDTVPGICGYCTLDVFLN
jgi:hypothetical protein